MEKDTNLAEATVDSTSDQDEAPNTELVDELLIEEISIDGMCGVY